METTLLPRPHYPLHVLFKGNIAYPTCGSILKSHFAYLLNYYLPP